MPTAARSATSEKSTSRRSSVELADPEAVRVADRGHGAGTVLPLADAALEVEVRRRDHGDRQREHQRGDDQPARPAAQTADDQRQAGDDHERRHRRAGAERRRDRRAQSDDEAPRRTTTRITEPRYTRGSTDPPKAR